MSAEETFLNLFDTFWFEQRPFAPTKKAAAPFPQQEKSMEPKKLNKIATLMRKSHSDHNLSSKSDATSPSSSEPSSPSPKSVLGPHLQTILSGKEVESFDEEEESKKLNKADEERADKAIRKRRDRRRRRGGASRSLTELEVEELKGFMDLGFVFSDEDRDSNSRLASIIPGLVAKAGATSETTASRPYLSEAWERMEEEERRRSSVMEWRIPAFGNEMELKDHLRFWAHSVASAVR